MSYTVANLKTDITAVTHGQNLNQIFGVDSLIDRAARSVLEDVDPKETKRTVPVTGGIFDDVFDYAAPTDLKGDRIIDIMPQILDRKMSDRMTHYFNELFDATKMSLNGKPTFTVDYNKGQRTLRIQKNLPATTRIAPTAELAATSSGSGETWTAFGSATSLLLDTVNYIVGPSSVRATLPLGTSVTTNGLQCALSTAIDLSANVDLGAFLVWVYMPTGSAFASVSLRFGSSTGDYYSRSVTTALNENAFADGWNLLSFPWDSSVSSTGTPDASAIDYLAIIPTYTSASNITTFRVNNVIAGLPDIYNVQYYSGYLFRDATTGAFLETVTDDTNEINLSTDSYNLLLNKAALLVAQQLQGANAGFDSSFFREEYERALKRYKEKYKGEVAQTQNPYYNMPPKRQNWTRIQF